MTQILSSAHVHTTFCDGKTPARHMAKRAYEIGFVSLGFTSHAPQTFDPGYCIDPSREDDYKKEIRAIQGEYSGKMAIYLGIERDLFSCADAKDYDYFIASVHYFKNHDGSYTSIDGQAADLLGYVNEYCDGSGLKMAKQYYSMFRDYVLESRPAIIGHFDLLRYNNGVLHMYDEGSKEYRMMALDALRAMFDTNALLEVNTGGVARGYMSEPYPDRFLLKEWKNWGGEVIINSDCHDAKLLDVGYSQAIDILDFLGFDHVVRLNQFPPKGMWERISLKR